MLRFGVSLAVAAACALWAGAPSVALAEPDRVVVVAAGDADMARAIAQARATQDRFLAELAAGGARLGRAYVAKVALAAEDGGEEHVWVGRLSVAAGGYQGVLLNAPQAVPGLERGGVIVFDAGAMSDWAIVTNQGVYGGFTLAAMADQAPQTAAREVGARTAAPGLPPWWREERGGP